MDQLALLPALAFTLGHFYLHARALPSLTLSDRPRNLALALRNALNALPCEKPVRAPMFRSDRPLEYSSTHFAVY